MSGSQLDRAYAEAAINLGEEAGVDFPKELTLLTEIINSSNNLESLLFLSVFTSDEKKSVLNDIFVKVNFSPIVKNFIFFLIEEKRIGQLPSIYKEMIVIDDHKKGFLKGVIESADGTVDEGIKKQLLELMKKKLNANIELSVKTNSRITAGYKVTVGELQVDATIDNQLEQLKRQILAE